MGCVEHKSSDSRRSRRLYASRLSVCPSYKDDVMEFIAAGRQDTYSPSHPVRQAGFSGHSPTTMMYRRRRIDHSRQAGGPGGRASDLVEPSRAGYRLDPAVVSFRDDRHLKKISYDFCCLFRKYSDILSNHQLI